MDLNNQKVVTQHCPGDIWKSCIYFEKVVFNRSVAAVEEHGHCELLFVAGNALLCPSPLAVCSMKNKSTGLVLVPVKIPLLQSPLCSPQPVFAVLSHSSALLPFPDCSCSSSLCFSNSGTRKSCL